MQNSQVATRVDQVALVHSRVVDIMQDGRYERCKEFYWCQLAVYLL